MKLTPQRIRQLLEIAYVLEPILDKPDCTTRFRDLPGKPLCDFMIAGLNVSRVFEQYADSVINHGNDLMFSHYTKAVSVSNEYKCKKTINLGLTEMMFVFVKTRVDYPNSIESVLENLNNSLKHTRSQDVLDNLGGFQAAISTSTNKFKRESAKNNHSYFKKAKNVYELFGMVLEKFPDKNTAGHQVALQYLNSFPIVQRYISEINEKRGLIKSIENTFKRMHEEDPETKIGLLADLSAIAIFLYLSFKESDYIVR